MNSTYNLKWRLDVNFDKKTFTWKEPTKPDGSYPLSTSAAAAVVGKPIANTAGQALLNAEKDAMKNRCENVL